MYILGISIVVVPAGHTARYSCTIFAIDMRRQLQKLIQLLFSPFDDINIRKIKDWQMQRYRKTLTVMKVRSSYVSIPFGCVGER